jgi:hypothetical protein
MGRILLSICLLAGSAWSQTIAISQPNGTSVWKKGETHMIQWTSQNAGANVRIVLRVPNQSEPVLVISDPAPNSGSFSWTIPNTVAAGSYVIRVRSKTNNQATDDSDPFQIQEAGGSTGGSPGLKPAVPAAMKRLQQLKIDIPQPAPGRQYVLGDRIDIVFMTGLSGPYKFDLMTDDGKSVARSFGELDGKLVGGETHTEFFSTWPTMDPPIATGWYRIRIRTVQGLGSGVGNRIHIARPTEEVLVQLQPAVRDRHSRRLIDTDQDWQPDGWWEASKPGLARAGCDFRYIGTNHTWVGFIFRSQVTFPVETVDMTGKTLKEAWIYIEEKDQKDGYDGAQPAPMPYATVPTARGQRVYALTGPWDGKCIDTPGTQVGEIPWSADTCSVSITDFAKGWLSGAKPNHGLIIGSRFEPFQDWTCYFALSWYKVTLNLKFIQEK